MTTRHERLVQNQHDFRRANERLRELLEARSDVDGQRVPFLCECADEACVGEVRASLAEFEEAHSTHDDFFILRGHRRVDGEEVIGQRDGFDVVRKGMRTPA